MYNQAMLRTAYTTRFALKALQPKQMAMLYAKNVIGEIMKKIYLTASILLMVFLSGCTRIMYEGQKLPDSQVSKITSANIIVTSIDGKKVPYSGGNFASFAVKPGEHVLGLYLNSPPMVSSEVFTTFVSEPGKVYKLKGVFKNYWSANPTWNLQIIDEETGKNVVAKEGQASGGV